MEELFETIYTYIPELGDRPLIGDTTGTSQDLEKIYEVVQQIQKASRDDFSDPDQLMLDMAIAMLLRGLFFRISIMPTRTTYYDGIDEMIEFAWAKSRGPGERELFALQIGADRTFTCVYLDMDLSIVGEYTIEEMKWDIDGFDKMREMTFLALEKLYGPQKPLFTPK